MVLDITSVSQLRNYITFVPVKNSTRIDTSGTWQQVYKKVYNPQAGTQPVTIMPAIMDADKNKNNKVLVVRIVLERAVGMSSLKEMKTIMPVTTPKSMA